MWSPMYSVMPASPSPRTYGHLLEGDKPVAWLPKRKESPLPYGQRACELGALGGTRTPNLLIRSKIRFVQIQPSSSIRAAGTPRGDRAVPASFALVQIRC